MNEHELIGAIRARLVRDDARVDVGIGDDAAVLAPLTRGAVLSVDESVEGVHFDRRWLGWDDVGFRAYVAAFSDLAAMGADPVAGLVAMVLPPRLDDRSVLAIVDGVALAADALGAPVVGGNVASGPRLGIATTAVGEAPARPILRSGARPGDGLYVTGTLGAAALGRAILAAGAAGRDGAAPFVARWRRLRARFDVLAPLRATATSAIDVSDGLVADVGHLCAAAGIGARIETAALPLELGHEALASALGEDADLLALAGGEDYEIAFSAPISAVDEQVATRIGSFVEGRGVTVLDRAGAVRALPSGGHQHR